MTATVETELVIDFPSFMEGYRKGHSRGWWGGFMGGIALGGILATIGILVAKLL